MATSSTTRAARPTTVPPSPWRRTALAVGILFVVQMVVAMVGTTLIEAFLDGDPDRGAVTLGVGLMTVSGLAVVAIGLLMYPVLRAVRPELAAWYPAMRIVECLVSVACGAYLLAQSEVVPNHMLWVYLPTGVGGIVLTYVLLASRLVPRAVAVLGLVGYACLTIGVPLDLLGALDMSAGAGLGLLAPGGLFEVLVLPAWLITKGFRVPRS
jgi:hypothetical protein